ncbi:MAG TPA: UDP-4-amino-4,6-dideoxy-N-acetyl-beta-L-altrosamine transaminase [Polyangiaceae bacterium]|nr:UDP-4-amino-4,6-dideoxy-N-acetyl-beta-L-altrosamine transaminase [Polyangiaceae bacterium]
MLPYGRHSIAEDDIRAVTEALRSDWLTTGPLVERFERAFADQVGALHAVAVSSGTAALHACMFAVGVGEGDEVIVPAMTFAATANAVVYQGGTPVFADVMPSTLLVDPSSVAAKISARTKALAAVDYAGQPCDYEALRGIARDRGVPLVADACHSLGAAYRGRPSGSLADLTVFSFHPVKHITTGEGGMLVTDDAGLAGRARMFRNHGISTDHRQREKAGTWVYEMQELGYNYRLSDIQCALGLSQLRRLPEWVEKRRLLARAYDAALEAVPGVVPLSSAADVRHAYHLYVVRLAPPISRAGVYAAMRRAGFGVNVHYVPVHMHPFYRRALRTGPGMCPVAEAAYEEILSLPMFPGMETGDVERVCAALAAAVETERSAAA